MASALLTMHQMINELCRDDDATKKVALKFCAGLQHLQAKCIQDTPERAAIVCVFVASESVHAAQADKVVTYKVALNHFGKNSDVPFWKMVAEMEDLLLRASKDASLEPRIYYTRMPTFATPCPLCSEDNIRCYKVPAERGKRTSHKCVRCFNHSQRCAPNDDDPDFSPKARTLEDKVKSMQARNGPVAPKKAPSKSKNPPTAPPRTPLKDVTKPPAQKAESSEMARRRTVSQGGAIASASTPKACAASSAPPKAIPFAPTNNSNVPPKTPIKRPRAPTVCRPSTDSEPTRDPRKRTQPTNTSSSVSSAPASTSRSGGHQGPDRTTATSLPERPRSTNPGSLENIPEKHGSVSAPPLQKPPSLYSTLQKRRQSLGGTPGRAREPTAASLVHVSSTTATQSSAMYAVTSESASAASGPGSRRTSLADTPAPQRERFVTPEINFQGVEQGYMGLPIRLDPVSDSPQAPTEQSPGGSLRSTPTRPPLVDAADDGPSPPGTKRLSETSDDVQRKKRKINIDTSQAGKGSVRTPRRKSTSGAATREATPLSPINQYTPPHSRTTSPAADILPHRSQTPALVAPPVNLIASIDPARAELLPAARIATPRLPTPVSPAHQTVDLPAFIQADLLAASRSQTESSAGPSTSPLALPAPLPRNCTPIPSYPSLPDLSYPSPDDVQPVHAPPVTVTVSPPPPSPFHARPPLFLPDTPVQQESSMQPLRAPGPSTIETQPPVFAPSHLMALSNPTPPITPPSVIIPPDAPAAPPVPPPAHFAPAHAPLPSASVLPSAPAPAPAPAPQPSSVPAPPQYAQFVELVYQKAKEIVQHQPDAELEPLELKFAIRDMRLRLEKIDRLKGKASTSASARPLDSMKALLLDAGKKVVGRMQEAQRGGGMEDIVLETMIEELEERLGEMEKLGS